MESLSAPSAFHSAWKCHNLSTVFRAGVVNIPVKYPKERGRQSGCGLIRRRWELGCVTLYRPDRGRAVRGKLVVRSSGHCPFCHSPFFDIHITIVIRSGLAALCFLLFRTTFRCKRIEDSKEHRFIMTQKHITPSSSDKTALKQQLNGEKGDEKGNNLSSVWLSCCFLVQC